MAEKYESSEVYSISPFAWENVSHGIRREDNGTSLFFEATTTEDALLATAISALFSSAGQRQDDDGSHLVSFQQFFVLLSIFWEHSSLQDRIHSVSDQICAVIFAMTIDARADLNCAQASEGTFCKGTGLHHLLVHNLSRYRLASIAPLFSFCFAFRSLFEDFDPRVAEMIQATVISWIVALAIYSIGVALLICKTKFFQWWTYRIGTCRRCSNRRLCAPRRKSGFDVRISSLICFGWLILSPCAIEPCQRYLTTDETVQSHSPLFQAQTNQTYLESTTRLRAFEKENDVSQTLLRHEGIGDLSLFDFCGSGAFPDLPDANRASFRTRSPALPAPYLCNNCQDYVERTDRCSIFPMPLPYILEHEDIGRFEVSDENIRDVLTEEKSFSVDSELTTLMQVALLRPGETCGQHVDPIIYWDRLSYRPAVFSRHFYVWRTMPNVGLFQHDLRLVPWDGNRCVRCAVEETRGLVINPAFLGPYYIRPQPTIIVGSPVLHFMLLDVPKLSIQRAIHLTVRTPGRVQHGTLLLNTATGRISTVTIFDLTAPDHNCRTLSWCRIQYRLYGRTQTWWFPDDFYPVDYSHLDVEEIESQTRATTSAIAGPPQQVYSCQASQPDSGTTAYQADEQSFLQTTTRDEQVVDRTWPFDTTEGDVQSMMHMPDPNADRSRSDVHQSTDDSESAIVSGGSDDETDEESHDALVAYSLLSEPVLIPIGKSIPIHLHRTLVARFLDLQPGTETWDSFALHYVHPKPPDLVECITPTIAVHFGQLSSNEAIVLVDVELYSNSLTTCGEKEAPHIVRETWKLPVVLTRPALIFQLGLNELCRNIAFPCLVEFGDRTWVQQDFRPQTVLNGLFLKVIVPIPRPDFPLVLYLSYARQGVKLHKMFEHWRQQNQEARMRLDALFPSDDEAVTRALTSVENAQESDLHSMIGTQLQYQGTRDRFLSLHAHADEHVERHDHVSMMVRSASLSARQSISRPTQSEIVIYEFQQETMTSTLDPTLTRIDYRETIGALMDINAPGRLWNNFEIHQVRPLPADLDPLTTTAFIFVHPATLAFGLSFVLVKISVTHETAVCGRHETASQRGVYRVPTSLARQTFLINVMIWELCIASGSDQCKVLLPDRVWETGDLSNRILFDGSYIQVICTTPYQHVPVQQQLRASQNGHLSRTAIDRWQSDHEHDSMGGLELLQQSVVLKQPKILPTQHAQDKNPAWQFWSAREYLRDVGHALEKANMILLPDDFVAGVNMIPGPVTCEEEFSHMNPGKAACYAKHYVQPHRDAMDGLPPPGNGTQSQESEIKEDALRTNCPSTCPSFEHDKCIVSLHNLLAIPTPMQRNGRKGQDQSTLEQPTLPQTIVLPAVPVNLHALDEVAWKEDRWCIVDREEKRSHISGAGYQISLHDALNREHAASVPLPDLTSLINDIMCQRPQQAFPYTAIYEKLPKENKADFANLYCEPPERIDHISIYTDGSHLTQAPEKGSSLVFHCSGTCRSSDLHSGTRIRPCQN